MLIQTIEFDLRNPVNNDDTHFVVENTEDNYALIAHNRLTHNIQFSQQFDFQPLNVPKFIQFGNAVLKAHDCTLDSDGIDYGDEIA